MSFESNDLTTKFNLTYEKMNEDIGSIPINESDILFDVFASPDTNGKSSHLANNKSADDYSYDNIEKLILFKTNVDLENQNLKSDFSLNNMTDEFESLENRLASLQHFIDVSKKFFSLNKNK
jgi:hypothetical protein